MASHGNPTSGLQKEAQMQSSTAHGTGKSTVVSDGSVVTSSDPTTNPTSKASQKLKGDVSGAISGTVGSMEAATGAMLRNKNLEEKGRTKMQEEDERLGAKRGVMPVGSNQRHTKEEV
ncbi:hypothetical protein GGS26DRAFT_546156 [Hypomontagnella submonticulosa]|nr:hypothetical protein GGS26DRAFT_546156 [Hypomontagnella submonticulosa]